MAGVVPPQIESPKTFIGVGARELVILGVSGLLGMTTLFLHIHLAIRIGIGALIVGLGLALAFGRDRRSGKTIEAYLFDLLRFYRRKRFRQKGTSEVVQPDGEIQLPVGAEAAADGGANSAGIAGRREEAWLWVRPLPLGAGLLFSILSFAFLAGLLAWIWLGGLTEILAWLGVSGF